MKPGTYCIPSNEKEWRGILDIAESLGLIASGHRSAYGACPCIWSVGNASKEAGRICECSARGTGYDPNRDKDPTPTSAFISGMYEMAGKREVKEVNGLAKEYYSLASHEERIKALEDCVSPTAIMDQRRRLTKLEATFNDHLVKERAVTRGYGTPVERTVWIHPFDIEGRTKMEHIDYMFSFDPKASPKDIPFSVALEYMRAGRKVRREAFSNGDLTMSMRNGRIVPSVPCVNPAYDWHMSYAAIEANDWMVVPEP